MVMDGVIRIAAGTSNCAAPPPPVDDDVIGDGMQCTNHPYRNNAASSTGGICAFCLQEKLGKLVSSSSSSFFNAASSSSSSPSFRSDPANAASLSLTLALRPASSSAAAPLSSSNANQGYGYSSTNQTSTARRARIPFLLPHKKKKPVPDYSPSNLGLKRSKSAVAPRRCTSAGEDYGSGNRKRGGFWSFLYHSKPKQEKTSSSSSSSARDLKPAYVPPPPPVQAPPSRKQQRSEYVVVVNESVGSPYSGNSNTMSFGGKVSRSRSVGCGSRSFSGDFFEKISTGFGDCTLRRVESQREGRRCSSSDVIQEKVRCAGIFGGFMMTSSSSSYWLSEGEEQHVNGKDSAAHGRSRSWGWALASPMRALTKPSPSSSSSTRDLKSAASKSNATTPNLAAIPSLLTARG